MDTMNNAAQTVNLPIEWADNTFKKKDLRSGMIYILKNGEVRLYLGIEKSSSKFVFYQLGSTYLVDDGYGVGWHMLYGKLQANLLLNMCQQIMRGGFTREGLVSFVGVPELRCAWYQAYTPEQLEKLCRRNALMDNSVRGILQSIIFTSDTVKVSVPAVFVSTKDLVPGCVYYSGQTPWRATFVYIGRLADSGKFVWVYIGNGEAWDTNPCDYVGWSNTALTVTNANKKVRPLTSFPREQCDSISSILWGKTYDITAVKKRLEPMLIMEHGAHGAEVWAEK